MFVTSQQWILQTDLLHSYIISSTALFIIRNPESRTEKEESVVREWTLILRKELQFSLSPLTGVVHPTSTTKDIYSWCAVVSVLTPAASTDLVRQCTTPSTLLLGTLVRRISSSNHPTHVSHISPASGAAKLNPELYNLFEQGILAGLHSCHRQAKRHSWKTTSSASVSRKTEINTCK